jgi:hypothetical protein
MPTTNKVKMTAKMKLSFDMKQIIRAMRGGGLLFDNKEYRRWFVDRCPVSRRTAEALIKRGLIETVVKVSVFDRYELTDLGKSIPL